MILMMASTELLLWWNMIATRQRICPLTVSCATHGINIEKLLRHTVIILRFYNVKDYDSNSNDYKLALVALNIVNPFCFAKISY